MLTARADVRRRAARRADRGSTRCRAESPRREVLLARRAAAARARRRQPLGCGGAAPRSRASPKRTRLPVACAFRNQDLFDNRHPHYAGDVGIGINPKLAARVRDADVLLVIGERLGEMTTSGYTLLDAPVPKQPLIHVHPGRRRVGPRLSAGACDRRDARRLSRGDERAPPLDRDAVAASAAPRACRIRRVARAAPGARRRRPVAASCTWLDERLPDDAILDQRRGQLRDVAAPALSLSAAFARSSRPTRASMGYGVPAAVAAKVAASASASSSPGTATAAS